SRIEKKKEEMKEISIMMGLGGLWSAFMFLAELVNMVAFFSLMPEKAIFKGLGKKCHENEIPYTNYISCLIEGHIEGSLLTRFFLVSRYTCYLSLKYPNKCLGNVATNLKEKILSDKR
ncbi:hypothetical protein ACJX0J_008235, partial [Zea mays]